MEETTQLSHFTNHYWYFQLPPQPTYTTDGRAAVLIFTHIVDLVSFLIKQTGYK